ncbi:MAG: nucleotidyltransferase domain-containing protein [Pseudomonadota bacterium]
MEIEVGLLVRETVDNQLQYGANRESPIFEELAGILRKTSGIADMLAEAPAPLAEKIELSFVFGSIARDAETTGNDVDVLVVGDIGFSELVKAFCGGAHARIAAVTVDGAPKSLPRHVLLKEALNNSILEFSEHEKQKSHFCFSPFFNHLG